MVQCTRYHGNKPRDKCCSFRQLNLWRVNSEGEYQVNKFLSVFLLDDDGAVTVDFVVLTAAICILGFIVVTTFAGATTGLGNDISNTVAGMPT